MLHAVLLTSPHAHAKITSIDTSEAEKIAGVAAVRVIAPAGTEIQWAGRGSGRDRRQHRRAARAMPSRKIKVDYEVMPHFVREDDLKKVKTRAKPGAANRWKAIRTRRVKDADVGSARATYGIPVLTHCCLETHGGVVQWTPDNKVEVNPSRNR